MATYNRDECEEFLVEFKDIAISRAYPGFLVDKRKLEDAKKGLATAVRTSDIKNDTDIKKKYVDMLQEVYESSLEDIS